MEFFESIEMAPPDPILGLNVAFKNDVRKEKINLGVGAYKTAELKPLLLRAVKQAEQKLIEGDLLKEYLPIEGDKEFLEATSHLVFGQDTASVDAKRRVAVQSVGGTGALAVGAKFLKKHIEGPVFISDPSWGNHKWLFSEAGLSVKSYPYYDAMKRRLDFEGMKRGIEQMPKGAILLLHAVCHNPTGFDLTEAMWEELAPMVAQKEILPFFDLAYQGFGDGLQQDAYPVRLFAHHGIEMVVASSYSKNFGLYAERIGALFFVCREEKGAKAVRSQVKKVIRGLYSNPPCHGARIVSTILNDEALCKMWQTELETMRLRIREMRKNLVSILKIKIPNRSFEFILQQKGMFSFTGLNPSQVDSLKSDYGIYLTKDGRMNIAGLTTSNLDYVTDGFVAV